MDSKSPAAEIKSLGGTMEKSQYFSLTKFLAPGSWLLSVAFFTFSLCVVQAEELDNMDHANINIEANEPLFVSLGSYCEPGHMVRLCGLRKAAFPFDWVVSMDLPQLCEILDQDFARYLNTQDLVMHHEILLHPHHFIEFLHDGRWSEEAYAKNMEAFQLKYSRRIERFRQLNHYQGKVFFLRFAYYASKWDTQRVYNIEANEEITKDHAWRLHESLRAFFPDLDFTLIIMNVHDRQEIEEEEPLCESLRLFRANPHVDVPQKLANYDHFFETLSAS